MEDLEEDSLLLDNIDEFVNDQNRIVTYKWISMTLQLDVNRSKRLLERFAEGNVDLNVLYFVGGWKNTDFDAKVLSYTIVKKENLLKAKENFSQLTCCDVYSIQKCKIQDSSMLYSVDSEIVKNNLFLLNKYNTIQCHLKNEKRSVVNSSVDHSLTELHPISSKVETTDKFECKVETTDNLNVSKKILVEKKLPKKEVTKDTPALSFFGNKQSTAKKSETSIGEIALKKKGDIKSSIPDEMTSKKKVDIKSSISDAFNKSVKISKTEKITTKPNEEICVEQNFSKNKEKSLKEEKFIRNIDSKIKTNDSFNKNSKITNNKINDSSETIKTKANEPSNIYTEKMQNKTNDESSKNTETIKKTPDKPTNKSIVNIQSKANELSSKNSETIKKKQEIIKEEYDESSNNERCSINLKPVEKAETKKELKSITMNKKVKDEETNQTKKTTPRKRKLSQEESDSDDDFENFLSSNKSSSKSKSETKSKKTKKINKTIKDEDEDVDVEIVTTTPEIPELKVKRRKKVKKDVENDLNQQHLSFDSTQEKDEPVCNNSSTGKRRGRRNVLKSKQFFGDDGYMITQNYYEVESFSEESDSETQQKKIADANEKTAADDKKTEKTSIITKQKPKQQAYLNKFFKKK
ncbi:DNA polymerase delta subunit 3 isoform X2 [Hydra vulgaris]|uniref:DNA polymerase delta subunit 3 n=1 Tax=Hydra vulgaris TaxID=6087 RepID=A0ABM4B4K9_HYDVU